MKKIKKGLALSLALAMGLSLCACGDKTDTTTAGDATDAPTTSEAATDGDSSVADTTAADNGGAAATMEKPGTDGEKIYVYGWNEEFVGYIDGEFKDKYPEYKDLIETVNLGMGGGSDEYKTAIENAVSGNTDQYASVFGMDDALAPYFMASDYTANYYDLGITDEMYANCYSYTKDYATFDGQLKGLTWQATPGCFCYRRDIAQDVLGVSEPEDVQEFVKDWDTFKETAAKMKEKDYFMVSGVDDLSYPFRDAVTSPWVIKDGETETLNIDQAIKDYMEMTKVFYDNEYTNGTTQWSDAWNANFDKNVFGYFGCTWFTFWNVTSLSKEHAGDWGMVAGPAEYHWGGTYIAVGKDTPNPELAAFIAYTFCCDEDFMYEHLKNNKDFVNNKNAVQRVIDEGGLKIPEFADQDPLATWAEHADKISLKNATTYDSTFYGYLADAVSAYDKDGDMDAALKVLKDRIAQSYSYIVIP